MPNISGAKQLVKRIKDLKMQADKVQDKIVEKQNWLDRQTTDQYRESEKGQEWLDYLDRLENFVYEVMNIYTEDIDTEDIDEVQER